MANVPSYGLCAWLVRAYYYKLLKNFIKRYLNQRKMQVRYTQDSIFNCCTGLRVLVTQD